MTQDEMDQWEISFRDFHARFAHLFARSESREQSAKNLCGLLAPVECKNGWQMAEAVGDKRPVSMESPLYRASWDADQARDILEQFVSETFGDLEGIGVVDETGILKEGDKSAGAQPRGRPRTKVRLAEGAPHWKSVAEVVAHWPARRRKRLSVAEGEKGPREYDWARSHVLESRGGLPGSKVWLLARRSVSDPQEIAYYLCLASGEVSLRRLADGRFDPLHDRAVLRGGQGRGRAGSG